MAFDLNAFSPQQLDALIAQAKERKTTLKKRKPITSVRKKLTELAAAEGYSVAELFGAAGANAAPRAAKSAGRTSSTKGRKLGKVPPKYRNPANKAETWTGRGKQPLWLAAQIKKGKKIEEFLIK
ncbi:H-NS family nucleoid-associated regulatory protein [Luteimonas deserti]|uniref:H-NS histone family protein n=1 Tax=Luteimonas deserti TaxID=2752306 RepID=A0A7Z0TXX6_9GAMM|nr:H-NS histone family protein [Luteimonas deserti]NYZ62285.1 H-NS histone family protein [Luteimonas deserti]